MTLCKRFLLIFAMFAAMPVYAAVDPQPTDGIRQIMVKSSDEIDVIMSQVNIIEGNMPTPLDPSQNIVTIDQPGSYVLTGSKVGGTIEIITPNVCLDLNGWTVEGTTDGTPIISIDDSFVTVKNGLVRHGGATTVKTDGAIEIVGNPRGVELRDLSIVITNTLTAINFSTAASECLIADCLITGTPTLLTVRTAGVKIDLDPLLSGSSIIVENCQIEGFTYGVYLEQGNSLIVRNCFLTENIIGINVGFYCPNTVVSNNIVLRPELLGIGDASPVSSNSVIINNIIVGCRGYESIFVNNTSAAVYGNLAINYSGSMSHYNVNVPLQVDATLLTTGTSIGEYANITLP